MNSTITIVGNVTRQPEVRYTGSGMCTASFGVAVNRRLPPRADGSTAEAVSFFNVVAWQSLAENAAESLNKGNRVVVTGRLEQRSWETPEGDRRSIYELVADEIGPSLRWVTARLTRVERIDRRAGVAVANSPSDMADPNGPNDANDRTDGAHGPDSFDATSATAGREIADGAGRSDDPVGRYEPMFAGSSATSASSASSGEPF